MIFHLVRSHLRSRFVPPVAKPKLDWRFFLLLPIPLIWALLAHYGHLSRLENQLIDVRFRARGDLGAPVKLIYVNVDNRALGRLGERPWNREKFAIAANALLEHGRAKAVGFDFVFSAFSHSELVDAQKANAGNLFFARVVRKHPSIVLGVQYTIGESVTQGQQTARKLPLLRLGMSDRAKNDVPEMPQYPIVGPMWGRVGLIDFDMEYGGDAVPRWVPMFAHTMNPTLYHMSLQLVLQYLGLDEQAVKFFEDRIEIVRPDGHRELTMPLREGQLVEVNWFSQWRDLRYNPQDSLADVLGHAELLASEKLAEREAAARFFDDYQGAIVLIGPTDELLQDLAPTSMDKTPVPKVSVHGNLIKTILSGQYVRRLDAWWVNWACVFGLTLSVTALAVGGGARGLRSKLTAVLLIVAYVWICLELFSSSHLVLPMAAPLGAAFTTSFLGVMWQLFVEEKQKGRIKGMFGAYVSPELVNQMVESGKDPQLGGHDDEITAYFSDIQGFSSFSEKLGSGPLVELMNEYLTACTDIVQAQGGTLDKYIGDAVVAMFGAPIPLPDHAYRACVATQLVHQKLAELRAKWKGEGDRWPEIVWKMQSRIGLNTGMCMIGNMGSRTRFNYTMMGDNVNLAARMESGAKSWGAYTMVTEATKLACERQGAARVVFRALGKIVVMGRSQPVPIFEIVGLEESIAPSARECIGLFEQGLRKYHARDWEGASALFKQSVELEPNQPGKTPGVKTNPSLVYLEKVIPEAIEEPPPANWEGEYVMKEK